MQPLADDLAVWREQSDRPAGDALLFPGADGEVWTANASEKWRQKRYDKLLEAAKLGKGRPYDLRHSFASLLLHEGRDVIYVARQLGHGAALTLSTYGHVIEELEDSPQLPAEDAIEQARRTVSESTARKGGRRRRRKARRAPVRPPCAHETVNEEGVAQDSPANGERPDLDSNQGPTP